MNPGMKQSRKLMDSVKCDNCNSYKITVFDLKYKLTYGILLIVSGYGLSLLFNSGGIGVLFGIIGYSLMFISLGYFYMAITHKNTKYKCKNCNKEWRV